MSLTWSSLVWAAPEPRGADRLCLLALADHADEAGECWPSQARISRYCAVSERAVRATLSRLEAEGFIVRKRKGRGHLYRLQKSALKPVTSTTGERGRAGEPGGSPPQSSARHWKPTSGVLPTNSGSSLPEDTGSAASRHRKSTSAEPSENRQVESPTEPAVGRLSDEATTEYVVTCVLAQLVELGVTDPDAARKVSGLIADHGAESVRRIAEDLGRQNPPPRSPLGWLIVQSERAAAGLHTFQAFNAVDLVERGVYGESEREQAIRAGVPDEHFHRTRFDVRNRQQWMYLPNGPRQPYADSLTSESAASSRGGAGDSTGAADTLRQPQSLAKLANSILKNA